MKNKLISVSPVIENRNSLSFLNITNAATTSWRDNAFCFSCNDTMQSKSHRLSEGIRILVGVSVKHGTCIYTTMSMLLHKHVEKHSLNSTLEADILLGHLKKLFTDEYSRHRSVFSD